MKKRNTTIFAFLLLAAVGMGVGYAALTDTLTLTGTANADTVEAQKQWDEDIYFSAIQLDTTSKGTLAAPTGLNTNAASFSVSGLQNDGDAAVVQVTVKNDNADYAAKLTLKTDWDSQETHATDGCFTASDTFVDGQVINPGESYTFTVTITLDVMPTTEMAAKYSMSFEAVTVNPGH